MVDPAALSELQDATVFYITHSGTALSLAFVTEFERVARLLLVNPHMGAAERGGVRQYALRRFPYSIVYQIAGDEVRIIALAHQRRKPGYWRRRK